MFEVRGEPQNVALGCFEGHLEPVSDPCWFLLGFILNSGNTSGQLLITKTIPDTSDLLKYQQTHVRPPVLHE